MTNYVTILKYDFKEVGMDEIILADGKYRFYVDGYSLKCDRYGEKWREFTGDNAVWYLFLHAIELGAESDKSWIKRS